ncbi:autotransporter outer membrane beta-barrel domain-containing protein [Brucellaceae bacterium C25G]
MCYRLTAKCYILICKYNNLKFIAAFFIVLGASNFHIHASYSASGGNAISTDTVNYSQGGLGGINGDVNAARGKEASEIPNGITYGGGGGAQIITTGEGASGGSRITYASGMLPDGITGATASMNASLISSTLIGGSGISVGAGGGGGGVGATTMNALILTETAIVNGGRGGIGQGSSGGGGGGVAIFTTNDLTVSYGALITGGEGGRAANSSGGGGGAAGVLMSNSGSLLNSGVIRGGAGGGVHPNQLLSALSGAGGNGGEGVLFIDGGILINEATGYISGGASGSNGTQINLFGIDGSDGGIGILGSDLSVLNKGQIHGGATYTGGMGKAIYFNGGVNSLEIWSGSTIVGDVVAFSAEDQLILGGTDDGLFEVTAFGDFAQYQGFGKFYKTGSSRWVLNGATTATTPWTLKAGILAIEQDASLGSGAGSLNLDGGTIEVTESFTTERLVNLTSAGGNFDVGPDVTWTVLSSITGEGSLIKLNDGMLVLTADNTFTGATLIQAGAIQLGDGGSSGRIIGDVINHGELIFHRNNLDSFTGRITGTGLVRHTGSGNTIFNNQNDYTGITSVENGRLIAGGSNFLSPNSKHIIQSGALLDLNGYSQTIASLINNGTVKLSGSLPQAGAKLNLSGDYIGDDGTLIFNGFLGRDEAKIDQLIIQGDSSGTGKLLVYNLANEGAVTREGLKIIEIEGASNATFSLLSDYNYKGENAIISGAYAYRLYKNGVSTPHDGNWYLRSSIVKNQVNPNEPTEPVNPVEPHEPLYNPAAPVFETYPNSLLAMNEVATLQQRTGDRYWNDHANTTYSEFAFITPNLPVWSRIEAFSLKEIPEYSTSSTSNQSDGWKILLGLDGQIHENESRTIIGGLVFHGVGGSVTSRSRHGYGKTDISGYGLGGTLTWYGYNGFYMDSQAQFTWYKNNLYSRDLKRNLVKDNHAIGYVLSGETGHRIKVSADWMMVPQAQLSYSSVDFNSFKTTFMSGHSYAKLDRADSLEVRIGLALDYQKRWTDEYGNKSAHFYTVANYYRELLNGTTTDISGVKFSQQKARNRVGIGFGGNFHWDDDKSSIFGEVSLDTDLKNSLDTYKLKGRIGYKLSF